MKINLDLPVLNFDGKPVMQNEGTEEKPSMKPLLFRDIVGTALNAVKKDENQTSEEKLHIFQLGMRLFAKKLKEYDLTTDQVALLTKRIDMFYGALVLGRWKQLIGDLKEEKESS